MYWAIQFHAATHYDSWIIPSVLPRVSRLEADQREAIESAFRNAFVDGEILSPASGSGNHPIFFIGFSGRIEYPMKNISGTYYLVPARDKQQAYAYLARWLRTRPCWLEPVKCRRVKAQKTGLGV